VGRSPLDPKVPHGPARQLLLQNKPGERDEGVGRGKRRVYHSKEQRSEKQDEGAGSVNCLLASCGDRGQEFLAAAGFHASCGYRRLGTLGGRNGGGDGNGGWCWCWNGG
jgi:hypothetical protein